MRARVARCSSVWPVPFLLPNLSSTEEEIAFRRFQRSRLEGLRAKLGRGKGLSKSDEKLYQALHSALIDVRRDEDFKDALTDLFSLETSRRLNPIYPCMDEWERMGDREKRRWVLEEEREVPQKGDQLIAINGCMVPVGIWDRCSKFDSYSAT
eukprot:4683984-Prymnesium_polylepis.2